MNIQTEHVTFSYRKKQVLSDLTFTAKEGRITYLAGRNGSGKTTWILLGAGLLPLSGGSIRFDGKPFEQVRPNVSIAFDTPPLYPGLSLLDNLRFLYNADVRSPDTLRLLDKMGFQDALLHSRASRLSYGQKHRAGIAGALLRNTGFLILDEPDLGLDPVSWEQVAALLLERREEGACILLTGQHFETLAPLIDDIAVLDKGRILFEGSSDRFLREWKTGGGSLREAFEHLLTAYETGAVNGLPYALEA